MDKDKVELEDQEDKENLFLESLLTKIHEIGEINFRFQVPGSRTISATLNHLFPIYILLVTL